MNKIAILFLALVSVGCATENRDPVFPLLPEYSESGVGAAGAIFNGEYVWRDLCTVGWFQDDCEDLRLMYDTLNQKTYLSMSGGLFHNDSEVGIGIELNDVVIRTYSDLKELEGKTFELDGNSGIGTLYIDNEDAIDGELFCHSGEMVSSGQLHIRKVDFYSDVQDNEYYTVSGTFGFDLTSPCWFYSMYQGRFDYPISIYGIRHI